MNASASAWVIRHSPTRGAERSVLVVLAEHADHVGGGFPSLPRLAQHTNLACPTVGRLIRRLEQFQHIDACRTRGRIPIYTIVVDPCRVGRPREPDAQ